MTDHYFCVVIDDYLSCAFDYADWSVLYPHVRYRALTKHIPDPDVLVNHINDCQIMVLLNEDTPITKDIICRLPNLKLIIVPGMSNRAIDYDAVAEKGIAVCGTEKEKYPIVELTWSLILSLARDIPQQVLVDSEDYPRVHTMGTDIHNKTLGIVGFNSMARQVAHIARAFGMNVLVWSPEFTEAKAIEHDCTKIASLSQLLKDSDFVTIHCELNSDTYQLLDASALANMKETAFLINTSRNAIIDTEALIECLTAKKIRGAALDVFDVDPMELYEKVSSIPNLIATPHLGYVTEQSYAHFFTQAIENIERFIHGDLVRQINK